MFCLNVGGNEKERVWMYLKYVKNVKIWPSILKNKDIGQKISQPWLNQLSEKWVSECLIDCKNVQKIQLGALCDKRCVTLIKRKYFWKNVHGKVACLFYKAIKKISSKKI